MHQSKVSVVKSQNWDNFSVFKNSAVRSPGFIPIPCPTHTDYSITNICKSPGCIQPLCPQCITGHVQLHQQTKKTAKIQNIINTRLGCIQKLGSILQQVNLDYQKYQNSCGGNLQNFIQKNRKKIQFAKTKIQNFVSKYFQQIEQKLQMLQIAYVNQKQKKGKQMKGKIAPLFNYIQQINQYKSQLQSEDYIPALIQLLNDPPKKPPTITKIHFEDYGEVKVDQYSFESFKTSLQSFVNVQSFLPQQNQFTQNINKNSSKFSNQMKFSKVGRSSSRQLIQSHLQASRNQSNSRIDRSNSRKKIFSNQKRDDSASRVNITNSTFKPISQQARETPKLKILYDSVQVKASLVDANYFSYDQGLLAYFPPNQKHFYAVQPICADRGFQRFELPQDFVIPYDHQSIITADSRIFLLGGRFDNKFLNSCFQILMRLSSKMAPSIKNLPQMKQQRAKFGAIYFNSQIYVFGGRKGAKLLSSCEKLNLQTNKWQSIKPMQQPLMSMNICTFNQKIIKFGGILQSGQILNRIDIYYPQHNEWMTFPSQIPFYIKMGSCQINKSQVLIFGGETQFNNKKNQCFILREEKVNQLKLSPCLNTLYNEGSFQGCFVYKNSVLAIQNGQDNKNKIIMKFQSGKWRFLSC